jgi:hypothetical protein
MLLTIKRVQRFAADIDAVFEVMGCIGDLVHASGSIISEVQVIVGPSVSSPRDVGFLRFDDFSSADNDNHASSDLTKGVKGVIRCLARELLINWSAHQRVHPLTNTFLAFQISGTEEGCMPDYSTVPNFSHWFQARSQFDSRKRKKRYPELQVLMSGHRDTVPYDHKSLCQEGWCEDIGIHEEPQVHMDTEREANADKCDEIKAESHSHQHTHWVVMKRGIKALKPWSE